VTIYIGNLSYQVTKESLKDVFEEYGPVKSIVLPVDRETGKVRGFGFVELENQNDEDKAIDTLDGAEWMGRTLKVNKAKPKENNRGSGGERRTYRRQDSGF
jgi:RNA recognition motif-containing protein